MVQGVQNHRLDAVQKANTRGARENRTVVGDNIQVADLVFCVPANTV